ncbi:MAG: UDP-2,3-diacylglucosamine diphosphatase [Betaproteobacteria bacterium]|nr:UDP-2,3-diacylglucosamine diphosphatase [Betaproteobacteria bacterium]NDG58641.1 UDP-2,3-diacylglucosamine diphosphatase [Betaproteobacteria bacterium]NDH30696.1 UDP-2,3-diacylglucosamine diphosphatase [Betaproteobacteria bacterium]
MDYKTIAISDVHLGSRGCKAKLLLNFLKSNNCETLYLIGDIIDAWKIQQNKWYWHQSHTDVVREILKKAKRGTQVVWIAGNHDEFLRPLIPYNITFGSIVIANQWVHSGIDGNRYLLVHGDLFDGITRLAPWISFLGDKAYDVLLTVNTKYNWWRHKLGFGYWSLSKYLKHKVKRAIDFMFQFELNLANYCTRKKFDGIICGHIHRAEIKELNGIVYMNTGDWVESCTAILEHYNGTWELAEWHEIKHEDSVDPKPPSH